MIQNYGVKVYWSNIKTVTGKILASHFCHYLAWFTAWHTTLNKKDGKLNATVI